MTQNVFEDQLTMVQTPQDFARCLLRLRQRHSLSLRQVQKKGNLIGPGLSKASLSEFEAGRRLPTRATLEGLLTVYQVVGPGQIEQWWAARERASEELSAPKQGAVVNASQFFTKEDSLNEIQTLIRDAREEVWLWGAILEKHIPFLIEYFERALAEGTTIKVLLIKPSDAAGISTSIAMSAFRAGKNPQLLERNLLHNLELLHPLLDQEGFELRLLDYLGPYTLYAYDPDSPHGKMDLRLSSFRGKHELRPTFRIEHQNDPDWFDYFFDQFMQAWNAAERVEPNAAILSRLPG
jgi:transcriptional regulator with XRE-family HTH domain